MEEAPAIRVVELFNEVPVLLELYLPGEERVYHSVVTLSVADKLLF